MTNYNHTHSYTSKLEKIQSYLLKQEKKITEDVTMSLETAFDQWAA